ncbi:class I SAM-dependent methyltransferase [Amycolatopsis sp. TRM77291]
MSDDYIFGTGSELGRLHMDYLEQLLDGPTVECLEKVNPQPGSRCLDLGAGGGSITRWLADRAGPQGRVVAVDLAPDYITEKAGVEVYRHDINDGLPDEGPYDVIHARLLLLHLPWRDEVFKTLVDALAPGGWLVIGEFSGRPLTPLSAPSEADKALWVRIQHVSHDIVGTARGINLEWAHEVGGRMTEAGLVNVRSLERSETTVGGDAACLLHRNLNIQAEPLLVAAGVTAEELRRYRELMLDPRFRAWFYQFVCTRGQRSANA